MHISVQTEDRPASAFRVLTQGLIRIDGDWVVDALQQRQVVVRIAVEAGACQTLPGLFQPAVEPADFAFPEAGGTGDLAGRFLEPRSVSVGTTPVGLSVTLERYVTDDNGGMRRELLADRRTPAQWSLVPGSYRLSVAGTPDTAPVYYPFVVPVNRSSPSEIRLVVPRPAQVPEGFAYIPPGQFFYGQGADQEHELERAWAQARPLRRS